MEGNEERFTVKFDPSTRQDQLHELAGALAQTFFLTQDEAEALLKADTLVLKRSEALTLARLCRHCGVGISLEAPLLTPAVKLKRWLKRFTMPLVFSLTGLLALLALALILVPDEPPRFPSPVNTSTTGPTEGPKDLPVVVSGESGAPPAPEAAPPADLSANLFDQVVPVRPEDIGRTPANASSFQTPAAPANTPSSALDLPPDTPAVAAPDETDLFTAARDFAPAALGPLVLSAPTVDLRDAYGQTPLMYAAESNSAEAVALLLEAGGDVAARTEAGWNVLMYAARNRAHPEVTELLLASGADPEAQNGSGQRARDVALAYNNADAVSALERATARLAARRQATPPPTSPAAPQTAPTPAPSVTAAPGPSEPRPVAVPATPSPETTPRVRTVPGTIPERSPALGEPPPSAAEDAQNRNLILECLQNWDRCASD